jgi:uncharacterized protein (DUF1786 family)
MPELNLSRILRSNLSPQPDSVPATIESLGVDIGASDVVVYLVDFGVGRTASDQLSAEEIVRQVGREIVEHHKARLDDDAILLLVQWSGPS